jgi:hypothetical protein
MKLLWFRKKYKCVNGHKFKGFNPMMFNGSERCPKCSALSFNKRA